MVSFFQSQIKHILIGNILFIVCCGFYLAWWLVAFRPSGTADGMKTGLLLIPASIAGLLGVILIIQGINSGTPAKQLFPNGYILLGGPAVFLFLLIVTVSLLKRPVTSELILIIGWGMLTLAEINALFAAGLFPQSLSVAFISIIGISVVISLICYTLYYRLDSLAGYIDGMIPLGLSALVMAGISGFIVFLGKR